MNTPRPLVAAIQAVLFVSLAGDAFATVDTTGLVYTPITPCRIVDTRVTGTPFAAKETRTFQTNGAATQGGGACTVYSGTIPSALSLNVTVDATSLGNPAQTGFLSLLPVAGAGTSWMNFFGGETIANAGVATINSTDGTFAIKTQNPANVVVDVYGYWVPSVVQEGPGARSIQAGSNTSATGLDSAALGVETTASGDAAIATGFQTTASGDNATAMGDLTSATASGSTAMGYATLASGAYSTAMGMHTTASGYASTALGTDSSTNGFSASFVYGDGSSVATTANTTDHQFMVRASGGFVFYTSTFAQGTASSTGAYLAAGSGSWGVLSDRNAKDAVQPVDSHDVLDRVVAIPLATWHYKAQDAKYRHMGPMAQDFYAAFKLGESETGIDTIDADGVALAAIQGLNSKLELENAELTKRVEQLENQSAEIAALRTAVNELKHEHTSIGSTAATP
jgi:hypothetical protein